MSNLEDKTALGHRVSVAIGYTRNMGNFESLRVDIGLEADGKPGDHPDVAFNKVYAWAEEKLLETVATVDKELKETNK